MDKKDLLILVLFIISALLLVLNCYILFNKKTLVIGNKLIIPLRGRGYICIHDYCVIIKKNMEFLLIANETNNCEKILLIYPYKPVMFGVVCNNSNLDNLGEYIMLNFSKK